MSPKSVTIEPNWAGMRDYVREIARTDLAAAIRINDPLNCERVPWDEIVDAEDREQAIAFLMKDGNLKVPCSRYGHDTETCAPVAFAAAQKYAEETNTLVTVKDLDYMMNLVVNDHDDVERFLGVECPSCGDRWTRFTDLSPSTEFQNWICDNCETRFKVFPDIGEEEE